MRISRDQLWMKIAHAMAERSTCFRLNVGAIIVFDSSIVASSYNGPVSGESHCHGNMCPLSEAGGCTRSVHAERNAIRRAENIGINFSRCTLYCTTLPCEDCAGLIVDKKFNRVVYSSDYRIRTGLDIMKEVGTIVHRLTPSGYLVDPFTNKIMSEP